MGIPDRIYRIGKAYIGQLRDRIDDKLADAERELDEEQDMAGYPSREDASPEAMMQRAEARIAAARRDLEARTDLRGGDASAVAPASPQGTASTGPTSPTSAATPAANATTTAQDPNAIDYRLMGVPVGSDLAVVQAAYEKLARRCDPRRFPDGSEEQAEAKKILDKINASYEVLRRRLDPTERRFGNLELE